MAVLVLDYPSISLKEHDSLYKKLGPPPSSIHRYEPGVILVISEKAYQSLLNTPKGTERVAKFSSREFSDSVICHYYFMYNPVKDVCIINSDCLSGKYTNKVLKVLEGTFTDRTTFWISVPLENQGGDFEQVVNAGFTNPYITSESPTKEKIPVSMAFTKTREGKGQSSIFTMEKAKDILNQHGDEVCNMKVAFSKRAVDALRKTPHAGKVKGEQRELTGELYPKDIVKINGESVYLIDIDINSIHPGEKENVGVSPTRYNFHSHPYEAYVRHSVQKAWPSVTDYLGYKKLGKNTIFHVVATLEGVYIISFTPYWADKVEEISTSFIDKNYDIDHKEKYTPVQYTKKVNSILYKGKPIYKVIYIPWSGIRRPFAVYFSKTGESCMNTQKTVDMYKKLHKN